MLGIRGHRGEREAEADLLWVKLILFLIGEEVSNSYRTASPSSTSHVMGLIAAGSFRSAEGAVPSHRFDAQSLPGHRVGMILSNNEEVFSKVSNRFIPGSSITFTGTELLARDHLSRY